MNVIVMLPTEITVIPSDVSLLSALRSCQSETVGSTLLLIFSVIYEFCSDWRMTRVSFVSVVAISIFLTFDEANHLH